MTRGNPCLIRSDSGRGDTLLGAHSGHELDLNCKLRAWEPRTLLNVAQDSVEPQPASSRWKEVDGAVGSYEVLPAAM